MKESIWPESPPAAVPVVLNVVVQTFGSKYGLKKIINLRLADFFKP